MPHRLRDRDAGAYIGKHARSEIVRIEGTMPRLDRKQSRLEKRIAELREAGTNKNKRKKIKKRIKKIKKKLKEKRKEVRWYRNSNDMRAFRNRQTRHRSKSIKAHAPVFREFSRQAVIRGGRSSGSVTNRARTSNSTRIASATTGTTLLQTTRVN